MTLTDEETLQIAAVHSEATDAPRFAGAVAKWFRDAILATTETGGLAAIGVGVRAGGMSAILCEIADRMTPPEFVVFSVDPYGRMPLYSPEPAGTEYGDLYYLQARMRLAPYRRSVMFKTTAQHFLCQVLPTYRWWVDGIEYPIARRFVSFAYVDGQHEHVNVVQEVAALSSFMAPGGIIAIANTELVPTAIALLKGSYRLGLTNHIHWSRPDQVDHQRDAFTVP